MVFNNQGEVLGCGMIILRGDSVLLECRTDGQGWCLAGGKIEDNETAEEAVRREMLEETGLVAGVVHYVGEIKYSAKVKGKMRKVSSQIFVTNDFTPTDKALVENDEVAKFEFVHIKDLVENFDILNLFVPTKEALKLFFKIEDKPADLEEVKKEEEDNAI